LSGRYACPSDGRRASRGQRENGLVARAASPLAQGAQYLRKHKLATEGTRVPITATKVKDPARIDNFVIETETPLDLTDQLGLGLRVQFIIA
jgi:hypothetical protein